MTTKNKLFIEYYQKSVPLIATASFLTTFQETNLILNKDCHIEQKEQNT